MPVIKEHFKMRAKHTWYSKLQRKWYKLRRSQFLPERCIPDSQIAESAEKSGRLVIQVIYGGLGDHLVYSALPELLRKQKQIRVFLSTKSIFRNQEIWDFIWKQNPYVEFTDEYGWFINEPLSWCSECRTFNEYLVRLFGLEGGDAPHLYYSPHLRETLRDCTVADLSFGPSGKANGYYEKEFQKRCVSYLYQIGDFCFVNYPYFKKNPLQQKVVKEFCPKTVDVCSLEDLCNVLASAGRRYLMYSGSASLAAALNLPSTVFCNKRACENFQYTVNEYLDL
jgi:hypothetical protein